MTESETREGQTIQRLAEAQATRTWRRVLARRRERKPVREAHGADDAVNLFRESYERETAPLSWP